MTHVRLKPSRHKRRQSNDQQVAVRLDDRVVKTRHRGMVGRTTSRIMNGKTSYHKTFHEKSLQRDEYVNWGLLHSIIVSAIMVTER